MSRLVPLLEFNHLGVTAVELQPVFQFDEQDAHGGLTNYWGYSPASCLILDVRMPNLDGLQLQRRLKEISPSIPVIFFSAHAGKEEEDQALRCDALAFLRKPVRRDDLLRAIRMALEQTS